MHHHQPVLLPLPFEDAAPSKRLRLVHATVVIRHGLRTPLQKLDDVAWDCSTSRVLHALDYGGGVPRALFVLRPVLFQSDLAGSCALGQLTRLGFEQHQRLGTMLRARYVERLGLLPAAFVPGTLYVRSSQYDRTIASAQALLSGLYPVRDQEITINIRHPRHENLYPREDPSCPALLAMFRKLSSPFRLYYHKYQAQELITTLETLALHGHPAPRDAPPLDEVHRQAARDHAALYGNASLSRLAIGNLLAELWGGMVQPTAKLRLFSAHDTTLLPLLGCLQQMPPGGLEHPPCASSLIFEVYEEEEDRAQRHVAVWYNSRPLQLKELTASVAPGYFKLEHVARLVEPLLLTDEHYNKLCHKT